MPLGVENQAAQKILYILLGYTSDRQKRHQLNGERRREAPACPAHLHLSSHCDEFHKRCSISKHPPKAAGVPY